MRESVVLPRKAWVVLVAAALINFVCGLGYIWSIIGKELVRTRGWTSTDATLPFIVFEVTFALTMAGVGPIQDRRGPRFVATIAGLLVGVGLVLTGFALRPLAMVVTFGVLVGVGLGSMYCATVPPALKWFPPSRKGLVNGTVVAMLALASIMYAPLTGALMRSIGIARTFHAIGAVALVLLTGLSRLIANPPEVRPVLGASPPTDTDGSEPRPGTVAATGPAEMLRTAGFYKMWAMFALSSAASTMIISLAATIAKVQAAWEGGLVLVILLAIFNAAGRTLGGMLSDRIGRPWTMRLAFALLAANMLLFGLYTSPLLLMVGTAVTGMCYGTGMVVFSAATADLYGLRRFGANYGLVYTAWGAGAVLALNGAVLYDATRSFHAGYLAAAGLALCALLISLTFRAHGHARPSR